MMIAVLLWMQHLALLLRELIETFMVFNNMTPMCHMRKYITRIIIIIILFLTHTHK